jgi:hypothetical protein
MSRLGYKGFPALFFLETMHSLRGDRNLRERMDSISERYDYLYAYLPVKMAKGKDKEKYDTVISLLMDEADTAVKDMIEGYKEVFDMDGIKVTSDEKQFWALMRVAKQRLYVLAAESGIIDDIGADYQEFVV